MYVIIDWHSHHAEDHRQGAIDFFREMAQTYGNTPNVIYEIYNEPLQISWSGVIKPYAEAVISAIRAVDPDNLIVVGTPTWSQDVDVAAADPITGYSNIAYTLHFYAATHKQSLRDKAATALSRGVALFVTEWGTCEASGSGYVDEVLTNEWVAFMKANGISNCNWSINDKAESASILNAGVSTTGGWTDANLTPSGRLVKNIVLNWGGTPSNTPPTVSITTPAAGATFTAPATITINANAADANGSVSSVAFYNGSTLLGTDNSSPYSFAWNNVAAGSYSLTARATDNGGATTTSAVVAVTVTGGSGSSNIALNKPTIVSSTENGSHPGSGAVDGNNGTRWSSAFSDPQWIYVDLGATYNINRVKITWETAYGRGYAIQGSANASSWTTMKTITGNTSLTNDHTGLSGSGRYIRIYGTARGTPYGYSIFELEVYGSGGTTPPPNTNLLSNPGFESGLASWSGNNATLTQDAGQKQAGTHSVKVSSRAASWAGPVQNIKTALTSNGPGTYNVSAWLKGESGTASGKVTVMLRYGGSSYYYGAGKAFNNTTWTQASGPLNLTWTGALEDATFYIETVSGQEVFFADACSLTKGTGAASVLSTAATLRQEQQLSVEVFPNPATDEITVRLGAGWGGDTQLRLVTKDGKAIKTETTNASGAKITLQAQPSGLYLLEIRDKNRSVLHKIIKK
jgi:hypothetical protein